MSSANTRAINRKPSNASILRAPPSSRPSSRAGNHNPNSAPSYMNPAVMPSNRPTSPTESISSTRNAAGGSSPPAGGRNKRKARDGDREGSEETNVQVVVRCRGRNEREVKDNSAVILSTPGGLRGKEVALSLGPLALSNKTYQFDRVFGPEADQSMIYDDVVQPIVGEMLSGYNCTIFAYGQTGTGKTYTMSGDMSESYGTYSDSAGIIPRTLYKLFHQLETEANEYSVKCSFIELYNEELRDLLSVDDAIKVKIFEDSTKKGIVIQGMEESYIKSAADGVNLLQEGSYKRQVAATKCNDLSSRSHTVFTITVHVKDTSDSGEELLRSGKLNLVDLAGSENIGRSGAENKRAREAGMINQSLLTLGRVINALVDKSSHIPYRESKLTRLLQDSLGGRTKTCIIATVSPAKINLEETISTLDYAARAKNIQNKPQINAMTTKKALIKEYISEIERLKTDLAAARQKHGVFLTNEHFQEMTEESESRRILIEEHERKITVLETQIRNTREKLEHMSKSFTDMKKELESQTRALDETKGTLRLTEESLASTTQKLREEGVLRRAHQATESSLDLITHDLITTVDTAAADASELHAKLRRKADLEQKNLTSWSKTQSQVSTITELVEAQISNAITEQSRLAEAVSLRINTFLQEETQKLDQIYSTLDTKLNDFNTIRQGVTTEARDATTDMNQVLEEIKILRDDVKVKVGEGMKGLGEAAQHIAGDVVRELERFNDKINLSYGALGREFKAMFDQTTRHLSAQLTKAEEVKEEVQNANQNATALQLATSESLDLLLREERDRAIIDRQSLIEQMTSLINATAAGQEARLVSRFGNVQTDMVTTRATSKADTDVILGKLGNWVNDEETFKTSLVQTRDGLKKRLQTDFADLETHNLTIQSTAKAIHAKTVHIVDAQMANVSTQMQALDDFVSRARSQNEKHHEAHIVSLDALDKHEQESTSSIKENITSFKNDLDSLTSNVQEQTEKSVAALEPFKTANIRSLSDLRNFVESNALREYVPTTHTPVKRDYNYPKQMPKTLPHNELLTNFRSRTSSSSTADITINSDNVDPFITSKSTEAVVTGTTTTIPTSKIPTNHPPVRVPLSEKEINNYNQTVPPSQAFNLPTPKSDKDDAECGYTNNHNITSSQDIVNEVEVEVEEEEDDQLDDVSLVNIKDKDLNIAHLDKIAIAAATTTTRTTTINKKSMLMHKLDQTPTEILLEGPPLKKQQHQSLAAMHLNTRFGGPGVLTRSASMGGSGVVGGSGGSSQIGRPKRGGA